MRRTLVISDIHGELTLFNALLEKIEYNPEEDQLILLGDYVDRGPDSKGVLNRVMALKQEGAIVLRGNHDEMMVQAVDEKPGALERWIKNGAFATLQGYDATMKTLEFPDTDEFNTHINFIRGLDYYYETDDYIFVHAGVEPDVPLDENDLFQLVWIREPFYDVYNGEKTVIFGHTPSSVIRGDKNHDVYFGENNIIGIDGAATYGGQLNCLVLPDKSVYSLSKSSIN